MVNEMKLKNVVLIAVALSCFLGGFLLRKSDLRSQLGSSTAQSLASQSTENLKPINKREFANPQQRRFSEVRALAENEYVRNLSDQAKLSMLDLQSYIESCYLSDIFLASTQDEIYQILDQVPEGEFEVFAEAVLSQNNSKAQSYMGQYLIMYWAQIDLQQALDLAVKHGRRDTLGYESLNHIYEQNISAARIWLAENKGKLPNELLDSTGIERSLLIADARENFAATLDSIDWSSWSDRSRALEMISQIASEGQIDVKSMIDQIYQIEDSQTLMALTEKMIESKKYTDASDGVEMLLTLSQTDPDNFTAYENLYLESMSQNGSTHVLDYVTYHMDEGDRRHETAAYHLSDLVRYDEDRAAEWLGDYGEMYARDDVVESVVSNLSTSMPDRALTWALKMQDDIKKSELMSSVYQSWLDENSDTARIWLSAQNNETKALLESYEN